MNLHDKNGFGVTAGGVRRLTPAVVCICALKIKKMAGIGITTYIMCFVISRNGIR